MYFWLAVRVTSARNRHKVVVNKDDLKWFSTVYFELRSHND